MLVRSPAMGRSLYDELDPPRNYVPTPKDPTPTNYFPVLLGLAPLYQERRPEVSYLVFAKSSHPRKPQSIINDTIHDNAPKVPLHDGIIDITDVGDKSYYTETFPVSSSTLYAKENREPTGSHVTKDASTFKCVPSPRIETVISLSSGDTTASGIGPSAFVTGASHHRWKMSFLARVLGPWTSRPFGAYPEEPATPTEVVKALRLEEFANGQASKELQTRLDNHYFDNDDGFFTRFQRLGSHWWSLVQVKHWHELTLSLSKKDCLRWERAGSAFRQESEHINASLSGLTRSNIVTKTEHRSDFVSLTNHNEKFGNFYLKDRCRNFQWQDIQMLFDLPSSKKNRIEVMAVLAAIISLTLLYSAAHLGLWNYPFPSRTEAIMWRISGATLFWCPASILLFSSVWGLLELCESGFRKFQRAMSLKGRKTGPAAMTIDFETPEYPSLMYWTMDWLHEKLRIFWIVTKWSIVAVAMIPLLYPYAIIFPVLYPFARFFLVVESFISLRHIPIGVYEGVGWAQYIPHL